ncbi:hypothetical protein C5167_046461 [Papaver somniferum]|uniref:Uncharacterized protein n=1 Tax=Papaver somniferum TaxID=3469 RepID=A0A4Y7LEL3_PAPSO|nr:hypothetical protein C5167_046461 [Papaver somniferum]
MKDTYVTAFLSEVYNGLAVESASEVSTVVKRLLASWGTEGRVVSSHQHSFCLNIWCISDRSAFVSEEDYRGGLFYLFFIREH